MPRKAGRKIGEKVIITIKGLEAHIDVDYGAEADVASGVLFDGATIIAHVEERFSGFCTSCMVSRVAMSLLFTRRQIEAEDVWAALAEQGADVCECDE